jgi:hypothetical protein
MRSHNHKKDKENGSKSYRNPAGHPIAFADKAFLRKLMKSGRNFSSDGLPGFGNSPQRGHVSIKRRRKR